MKILKSLKTLALTLVAGSSLLAGTHTASADDWHGNKYSHERGHDKYVRYNRYDEHADRVHFRRDDRERIKYYFSQMHYGHNYYPIDYGRDRFVVGEVLYGPYADIWHDLARILAPAPYGTRYVRVGSNDVLLVRISDGRILDVVSR